LPGEHRLPLCPTTYAAILPHAARSPLAAGFASLRHAPLAERRPRADDPQATAGRRGERRRRGPGRARRRCGD
jgi:hypothetical protein